MQAANRANACAVELFASVLLAALIATATPASAGESAAIQPAAMPPAPAPWVGVFTGQFENGVPVYRLPSVAVIAKRQVELQLAQQEKPVRASTARPSLSMRRSAPSTVKTRLALSAGNK